MRRKRGNKKNCCFADRVKNCFCRRRCDELIAPLSRNGKAGRVKVCKVRGNRKICARMASLGVYPGVEADIISAKNGSQCILKVNGGTISLDSEVSNDILVTQI